MRKLTLLAVFFVAYATFGAKVAEFNLASFRAAIEAAPSDKRAAVMEERLQSLKAKIDESEKPDEVDMDRVDLIILKNMFEPIVDLARTGADAKKCAVTRHEFEAYKNGDGDETEEVADGKALIDLLCAGSQ